MKEPLDPEHVKLMEALRELFGSKVLKLSNKTPLSKVKWTPYEYSQILLWSSALEVNETKFLKSAVQCYLTFLWSRKAANEEYNHWKPILENLAKKTNADAVQTLQRLGIDKKSKEGEWFLKEINDSFDKMLDSVMETKILPMVDDSMSHYLESVNTHFLSEFSKTRKPGPKKQRKSRGRKTAYMQAGEKRPPDTLSLKV